MCRRCFTRATCTFRYCFFDRAALGVTITPVWASWGRYLFEWSDQRLPCQERYNRCYLTLSHRWEFSSSERLQFNSNRKNIQRFLFVCNSNKPTLLYHTIPISFSLPCMLPLWLFWTPQGERGACLLSRTKKQAIHNEATIPAEQSTFEGCSSSRVWVQPVNSWFYLE